MIVLDHDTHTYYDGDFKYKNSVTEILKKERFIDFSKVPADVLEYATTRGKFVHLATALYDEETLDYSTLDKAIEPYLDAWIKFKKDSGIIIQEVEKSLGNKALSLACTPDRTVIFQDKPAVLEIKAVAIFAQAVTLQLAGNRYLLNLKRKPKEKIKQRIAVNLGNDGNYKLLPKKCFKDTDEQTFLSAYNCVKWREENL